MSKYDTIKLEIKKLKDDGDKLYDALRPAEEKDKIVEDYGYFINHYETWYSKALHVVSIILPERKQDFALLYRNDKRKKLDADTYTLSDAMLGLSKKSSGWGLRIGAPICMLRQVTIISSALESFDSKVYSIQTILQADIFDSEIESAKHLVKNGFLRAAGAICGVVIEKHLSDLCTQYSVKITKKNPSIAEYNDALKDNAYDVIEWRKIQHYADIRNYCDHKKEREPTKAEVEELIAGTEYVVKMIG